MRRFEGHQQGETKRDNPVFTESLAIKVSQGKITPARHWVVRLTSKSDGHLPDALSCKRLALKINLLDTLPVALQVFRNVHPTNPPTGIVDYEQHGTGLRLPIFSMTRILDCKDLPTIPLALAQIRIS
jgi:hypothetical protein